MTFDQLFRNTYVLSLPHRLDRREHIKGEFKNSGFSFEFFDAVNGHELTDAGPLLPGEHGIKESHIQILKTAIDRKFDSIFVFEDDAVLLPGFRQTLDSNLPILPDCDLLYLGGVHRAPLSRLNPQGEIYKTTDTYTTHAMWIKSTLFQVTQDVFVNHPDQQLDNCYALMQKEYEACVLFPSIVTQKNDYSDIQNQFVNYSWIR